MSTRWFAIVTKADDDTFRGVARLEEDAIRMVKETQCDHKHKDGPSAAKCAEKLTAKAREDSPADS